LDAPRIIMFVSLLEIFYQKAGGSVYVCVAGPGLL
jgi:hypothetical protein